MQQYIGFKLGGNEFTIPILKVREIINTPAITKMPQSQHYMKGIINLRGKIIPIVDLKELVSIRGGSAEESGGKVIVITNRNYTFGILVDGITSVINIDESTIEPPEHFMSENMDRVEGVAKLDDRLLILLDTDKLVAQQELEMIGEDMASAGHELPKAKTIASAQKPVPVASISGIQQPAPKPAPQHKAPAPQAMPKTPAPQRAVPQPPPQPAPQQQATRRPAAPAQHEVRAVVQDVGMIAAKAPAAPRPAPQPAPQQMQQRPRPAAPSGPSLKDIHDTRQVLSRKFSEDETKNIFLQQVVDLMERMAMKDFDGSDRIISEMLSHPESDLYLKIGHVTRKLHNSLKEFRSALDPRIKQLANQEVPQAVDRLEYVISKSEEAAHRTMGVVEKYQLNLPDLAAHIERANAPEDSKAYLRAFSASLNNDLNEIMLAQEFQDITGQTIHRVIDLVNTIEAELIGLIANFGVKTTEEDHMAPETPQKITQNEVEDLLKEFGF